MSKSALLSSEQAAPLVLADHSQHVGHGIVSRTVLATPELRVVLFSFAAGQALTEHTSTARALLHVLSGEGELQFGAEQRIFHAGEILHLPPNVPHAVRAIEPMTMMLVLAPERKAT
jgi:quercetin dioxygenase-like cupin family protein